MPTFNWKDLVKPDKWAANGHWLVLGFVGGIVAYHFLNPMFNPEIGAIQMRSPTQRFDTSTPTFDQPTKRF